MWEIVGKNRATGLACDHDCVAVGSRGLDRRSVAPAGPIATPPQDPAARLPFPLRERVLTLSYLRAEFTREDGAGGAGLGDEAGGDAAPRGDGGNLAERTASGTHGGHLVRSRCGSDCLVVSYTVFQCARVCGYRF